MPAELLSLGDDKFPIYANPGADFETKFIYQEIFVDKCYDVASLGTSPFIIDAGGNIGLFSIWMSQQYPSATILAFEPAPDTYATLQKNLELHKVKNVTAFHCGLGQQDKKGVLTFFPDMPGNSTLYPGDREEQWERVPDMPEKKEMEALVSNKQEIQVDIKRLSHFLTNAEGGLPAKIDLLKVDVEGAELEVLGGLDDDHWKLVQNVAMEICDMHGSLGKAKELLASKGFADIKVEYADFAPKEVGIYMVLAKR